MSRLNAMRIINLIYDHNSTRINDLKLEFGGKSTLLHLENGTGKSVIAQMVTSVNVTERHRNAGNRKYPEYFPMTEPTFILEEWKLEQSAGYMMCGFMVRRNPNYGRLSGKGENGKEEKELDIRGIVSEYSHPCEQDIRNLPVVTEQDGKLNLKTFAECRQLFDEYKKDNNCRFYEYNMYTSQARYLEKLAEYGVYFEEWQSIIKKANSQVGENSGLSNLFKDCQNKRGLVEKWFLTTIEGNLSRDREIMKSFRETLAKYIRDRFQNDEKIQKKSAIERFLGRADEFIAVAQTYRETVTAMVSQKNMIVCFRGKLEHLAGEAEAVQKTEETAVAEMDEKIKETEHARLSAEHASCVSELDRASNEFALIEEKIKRLNHERELNKYSKILLKMAEKQEHVNEAEYECQRREHALELSREAEDDLRPEKDYIGYLLHCFYNGEEDRLTEELAQIAAQRDKFCSARDIAQTTWKNAEADLMREKTRHGKLQARLAGYDEKEIRYENKWHRNLSRNVFGEYSSGMLESVSETVLNTLAETNAKKESNEHKKESTADKLTQIRKQLEDLRERKNGLNIELSEEEKKRSFLMEQLEYRKATLQYLELSDVHLYDKDAILAAIDNTLAEIEQKISSLSAEERRIEEEIRTLTTGRITGVPKELRKELDSIGINVIYGMEWLKKNGKSEEENLHIIANNPFLPYSLLMTEKEVERLSASDHHIYTSAPVPIVTREAVAEGKPHSHNGDGMHFYMYFNENLLNEERLRKLIEDKDSQLNRLRTQLSNRRIEYREYAARRDNILTQDLTKEILDKNSQTISEIKVRIQQNDAAQEETQGRILMIEKELDSLHKEITALGRNLIVLQNEIEDLSELRDAYTAYMRNRADFIVCEDKIKSLTHTQKKAEEDRISAEREIEHLNSVRFRREKEKEDILNSSAEFTEYKETSAPRDFSSENAKDPKWLRTRYEAIIEHATAEEKRLKKELTDAQKKLNREKEGLLKLSRQYNLQKPDWNNWHYDPVEERRIETAIDDADKDISAAEKERGNIQARITGLEKDCSHIVSEMKRICGTEIPLPEDDVPHIDYAAKKIAIEAEKKVHSENAKKAERRYGDITSTLNLIAEYEGLEASETVTFEEDFTLFKAKDFHTYTSNMANQYRALEKDARDKKESLEGLLRKALNDTYLQGDYFRKPIETLLSITNDAAGLLQQTDILVRSYNGTLEKLKVDIEFMGRTQQHITDTFEEYLERVYDHMNRIDKNASILIGGKPVKMLKITIPSWDEMCSIYRINLEQYVETLTSYGVSCLKKGAELTEMLEKEVNTKTLFDRAVGIEKVDITLYKVEKNGGKVLSWESALKNSGGEGTLSAFTLVSCLISYMRSRETDTFTEKNEGKVLLLDNPFASISSEHLLEPMLQLAEKNNIQLICLTALKDASIKNIFDNAYDIKKVLSAMGKMSYMVAEHVKGKTVNDLDPYRIEVSNDYEQLSFF